MTLLETYQPSTGVRRYYVDGQRTNRHQIAAIKGRSNLSAFRTEIERRTGLVRQFCCADMTPRTPIKWAEGYPSRI